MTKLDSEWGSSVAKRGFNNEEDIADKFRNWKSDEDAKKWLEIMGYVIKDIKKIEVENLKRNVKSDIEITIHSPNGIFNEGISIKRAKKSANYNQVDKRWVEKYKEKWDMPQEVCEALKLFVGRNKFRPKDIGMSLDNLKDERRLYFDELPKENREALKSFLIENKEIILRDVLKGDKAPTDWILITEIYDNETRWTLRNIDSAVKELMGDIKITRRGNIKIGKITLQRKGGDNGRETAQMLQFKMRPFDLVSE